MISLPAALLEHRITDNGGEGPLQIMGKLTEQQAAQAEEDGGEYNLDQHQCIHSGEEIHLIVDMVNAPQAGGYQIAGEAGGKTGQQRLMADQSDGDYLQAEYRTGQRGAEDGAEAAADATHQQDSAVQRTDSEPAAEAVCQTAAHLHSRAFASG